jgi:hypothetical protein
MIGCEVEGIFMDEKQIQSALEEIAMNESMTDELADDEAELLLQWGETQVRRLASPITDAEVFDEATHKLRKLMSRINWFIGLRGDMDTDEQRDVLHKVVESAQAIDYAFTPEQVAEFLQHPVAEDNCENMRTLTKWISTHDTTADDTPSPDKSAPGSDPPTDHFSFYTYDTPKD